MMVTSIGKFLRILRIENEEYLKTMAEHLGVSSAFLSAVENGKKKCPQSWAGKITQQYSLTPEQQQNLESAIQESQDAVEINISEASAMNKRLAISFARQFHDLDETTSKKIMSILEKSKRGASE